MYFFSDLVGNVLAGLEGLPNLNDTLFNLLKENQIRNEKGSVFLTAVFQAVLMCRWNLTWIFLDIALDIDFHRHNKRRNRQRESTGQDLMSPKFVGKSDLLGKSNMVEVWIVGIWTAFGVLHVWLPDYKILCYRVTALLSLFAMIVILLGDSKRMKRHPHSAIVGENGVWPWTAELLGVLINVIAEMVYIYRSYQSDEFQTLVWELLAMVSVFTIVCKSAFGIMGWRRKFLVSTLLAFLITVFVFELTADCGEQRTFHQTSAAVKHVTMWFWPEFLIDTLEHMAQDLPAILS